MDWIAPGKMDPSPTVVLIKRRNIMHLVACRACLH